MSYQTAQYTHNFGFVSFVIVQSIKKPNARQ